MNAHAERIKERNREWRRAQPAARSRMAALDTFGLRYDRVDDFNVIVEDDYQLNLAMSYWRSNDGTAQGYLVSTLDADFRRRAAELTKLVLIDTVNSNSEKPVTGRDSDGASRTASKTATHDPIAESVAGSTSPFAGSASLLPVVSP